MRIIKQYKKIWVSKTDAHFSCHYKTQTGGYVINLMTAALTICSYCKLELEPC